MKIYIGSDHAGFELKKQVVDALAAERDGNGQKTNEVQDFGPFSLDSVDYPDFADKVCQALPKDSALSLPLTAFGILICGSGQGMAMRANRYSHIRAALVYSDEIAGLTREHNDANIICLGARFCSAEQALKWINIFKKTAFAGGRHQTRVAKVNASIS